MEEKDNVELRSEKMRNFIGNIPRSLVTAGTVIIIVITLMFALAAWFIRIDGISVPALLGL